MKEMKQSDGQLYPSTLSDPDTFHEIYVAWHRQIYRNLFAYCHNPELANDLMQETFYRLGSRLCIISLNEELSLDGCLASLLGNILIFYEKKVRVRLQWNILR